MAKTQLCSILHFCIKKRQAQLLNNLPSKTQVRDKNAF